MPKLNVHKRTLGTDHGGRVFFCCHPDDVASAEHIIDDVLAISDCIAAIDGEPHGEENAERLQVQRPDRDPVAAGSRFKSRRLVPTGRHYLAQTQRHAGKCKRQTDAGT